MENEDNYNLTNIGHINPLVLYHALIPNNYYNFFNTSISSFDSFSLIFLKSHMKHNQFDGGPFSKWGVFVPLMAG